MQYRATLSDHDRHLVSRMESFGDVVIGFSMSQLALQLAVPSSPEDLLHVGRILGYFGTFALLVALWFSYHRTLSSGFAPTRIDNFLAFTYLAFTTVTPLALYLNIHFAQLAHPGWVRWGVGVYLGSFVGTSVPSAIILRHNFYRCSAYVTDEERKKMWKRLIAVTTIAIYLPIALFVDILVPIDLLWNVIPPGALAVSVMGLAIRISVAAFGNRLPTRDQFQPA